jgi:hypothetical protein
MKLADLRKLAVRQHLRIGFTLANGAECVIDEHGVVRIPSLKSVPNSSAEEELASAREFRIEPAAGVGSPARSRVASREELAAMTASAPQHAAAPHDEE